MSRRLHDAVERMRLVTRAVAESPSFTPLLKALIEAAMGIGGAESVGIYSTDPGLRTFTVGWETTQPDWPNTLEPGSRIPLSDWPSTLSVLRSPTPRAWLRTDPAFSDKERARLEDQDVGAQIDVPLVYGGKVLGFLNLFRRDLVPFDRRDRAGAAMASTMALAIASERLLEQATRQSRDRRRWPASLRRRSPSAIPAICCSASLMNCARFCHSRRFRSSSGPRHSIAANARGFSCGNQLALPRGRQHHLPAQRLADEHPHVAGAVVYHD